MKIFIEGYDEINAEYFGFDKNGEEVYIDPHCSGFRFPYKPKHVVGKWWELKRKKAASGMFGEEGLEYLVYLPTASQFYLLGCDC